LQGIQAAVGLDLPQGPALRGDRFHHPAGDQLFPGDIDRLAEFGEVSARLRSRARLYHPFTSSR
jgi:hypothetical protein